MVKGEKKISKKRIEHTREFFRYFWIRPIFLNPEVIEALGLKMDFLVEGTPFTGTLYCHVLSKNVQQ